MTFRLAGFALLMAVSARGADAVTVRFRATVGDEELACGRKYSGVGTTKSSVTLKDFRFYVHNVRLVDETGHETAVELNQGGQWQLDDVALLDFEDASGACRNGTPEKNTQVAGTVPAGHSYHGLRFTLGVPFAKNHSDLTAMPSPLNLTAMAWIWNAGRRFARIEFTSTGVPRGYAIHLGSTGCTPNQSPNAPPTKCLSPNRVEVELADFDPAKDVVIADLGALLADSDVDHGTGCESEPGTAACGPVFGRLGLPFAGRPDGKQSFFRKGLMEAGK